MATTNVNDVSVESLRLYRTKIIEAFIGGSLCPAVDDDDNYNDD